MEFSSNNIIFVTIGTIATVIGAWYTILKISKEMKKSRKSETEKLINEAKELDEIVKEKLESKINLLEAEIRNLGESVSKDISHIKETQANEIRNLASKVELLREELRSGHGSLVALLTQLVNKN
jgi:hypothetical protein